jgi:enoyl-CoA hydratase
VTSNASELIVESSSGVLRVTINRPDKRNALSGEVLRSLAEVFASHTDDADLRVAILRGAGDQCFAAGGDLRELASITTLGGAAAMARDAKASLEAIRQFPLPVVAALNGDAMGGGAELSVACDFRIAAAHARIGFVQGRLNISTAWGGGIDLMRLIGTSRALGLLCRGDMLTGAEAAELALIDAVAREAQSLDDLIADFIAPILKQSPQVLRAFKAVAKGVRAGLSRDELNEIETRMFAQTWVHEDHWSAAAKITSKWRPQ